MNKNDSLIVVITELGRSILLVNMECDKLSDEKKELLNALLKLSTALNPYLKKLDKETLDLVTKVLDKNLNQLRK